MTKIEPIQDIEKLQQTKNVLQNWWVEFSSKIFLSEPRIRKDQEKS